MSQWKYPFLICWLVVTDVSCQSKLKSQLITQEDGLSDNQVLAVVKDKIGYLWIGTTSGLNRFDGHDFKIFRSDLKNKNSLPSNAILTLSVDRNNIIWIGLANGMASYDAATGA